MYELSQIILWILWRLRPAMAVETNLVDILHHAIRVFEDEATLDWMDADPANCAAISAALMDAHAKLDLLIYLRACEIAGIAHKARDWRPCKLPHHPDRTVDACWRRFHRLWLRYAEVERLARRRAATLKREAREALPACFAAPAHIAVVAAVFSILQRCDRSLPRRGAAKAAEGCASARGPPIPVQYSKSNPVD